LGKVVLVFAHLRPRIAWFTYKISVRRSFISLK